MHAHLFVVILLCTIAVSITTPVLPDLLTSMFEGSISDASVFLGIITAGQAFLSFFFCPLFGALSDRFGRKPFCVISLLGVLAGNVIIFANQSIPSFIADATIMGVTQTLQVMAGASIMDTTSSPEDVARAMGLIGAATGLGFVIGPLLGVVCGEQGFAFPFLVGACIGGVTAVYALLFLPETMHTLKPLSCRKANPFAAFALFGISMSAALMSISYLLVTLSLGYWRIWLLYSKYRYGWDELMNGIFLASIGLLVSLVQGFGVRWAHSSLGTQNALYIANFMGLVMCVFVGLATEGWMVFVALALTMPQYVLMPTLRAAISQEYHKATMGESQGQLQGSLTSLATMGNFFGPLMSSQLFSYFISDKAPFKLPGAPFLLGGVCKVFAILFVFLAYRVRVHRHEGKASTSDVSISASASSTSVSKMPAPMQFEQLTESGYV